MLARLGGGADGSLSDLAASLATLTAQVRSLTNAGATRRARDPDHAVLLDGTCPAPLRACDPEEEARLGRTCPDMRKFAPDPLVIDEEGHVCYAPADLEKWAGARNMADVDTMIERGASELLRMISSNDALLHKVKETALQAAVVKLTKPRVLKVDAFTPAVYNNGAVTKPAEWTSGVIQAQEMDTSILNSGLLAARGLFHAYGDEKRISEVTAALDARLKDSTNNDIESPRFQKPPKENAGAGLADIKNEDFVFHPKNTGLDENAATVAFAGAVAWAERADKLMEGIPGAKPHRYRQLVLKLPLALQKINADAVKVTAVELGTSVAQLTFDVAWPLMMSARVGLRSLKEAAADKGIKTKLQDLLSADDFKGFTARSAMQQWSDMVRARE